VRISFKDLMSWLIGCAVFQLKLQTVLIVLSVGSLSEGEEGLLMGDEEVEVEGGYTRIRGEIRFVPLKIKRVAHCSSCLFFNRKYEKCSRGYYCYQDSPACNEYVNKTWKNGGKTVEWV
jgi:hypothetical protein